MVAAAAATSILSLYGSPALADTEATGAAGGSPGVLSGNNVQAPLNVPVNICGNSVDVAAALNPAFGNSCASESDADEHNGDGVTPPVDVRETPPAHDAETPPAAGDDAPPPSGGEASPPLSETPPPTPSTTPPRHSTPPAQTPPPGHSTPPSPSTPPGQTTPPEESTPPSQTTPPGGGQRQGPPPTLPHTGSEAMLATSAASAALIAGGTILYRRGRAASRRS